MEQREAGMRKENKRRKNKWLERPMATMPERVISASHLANHFSILREAEMKYREEFGFVEVKQSPVELQNEIAFLFAVGVLKHKEGHEQKVSDGPGIGGDMRLARADNLQLGSAG